MLLKWTTFGGMAPKIEPRLLPPQAAQNAVNCRFRSGALEPLRGKLLDAALSKTGALLSLFRYWPSSVWFSWSGDVNAVNSQIAGDPWERVYFTGDGVPKMTANNAATSGGTQYPVVTYNLGLPAPLSAPTATPVEIPVYDPALTYAADALVKYEDEVRLCISGITTPEPWTPEHWTTIDLSTIETRAYVYTYVSAYGEEGPPSPASTIIDLYPGQGVNLSGMSSAPAGAYNVTQKRIYRTNTGTNGTEYQLVATVPVATATFADSVASADLGGILVSQTWVAPPADLKGLISLPCGSLAGFVGNQLYFSVPFQPHAWPLEYRISVDFPIVAIGAFGNYVLIATTGLPYVVLGSDPANMSAPERIESGQACVSKRGMVDMGDALLYPAPDGLQSASSGSFDIITADILSRDDWQALNPSSISAFLWNGKYVGFYNNGTPGAFIFDPTTKDLTWLNDAGITAGFTDLKTGNLYLVAGQSVYKWDAGNNLPFTWKSRPFEANKPVNMAICQITARAYPVTFKLYGDGVLRYTKQVNNGDPFKLSSGYLATEWEVELSGSAGRVTSVALATSVAELRQN